MCARPRDKEEAIIAAASTLFPVKGFHATTMEDIAQEAGIGKGTIYEYFRSKEELFQQMILEGLNRYANMVEEGLQKGTTPEEKLREFVRVNTRFFQQHQHMYRMISSEMDQPIHPACDVKEHLLRIRKWLLKRLEDILKEGMKEGTFAEGNTYYLAAILIGMTVQMSFSQLDEEKENLEEYGDLIIHTFLHGIMYRD